ncbi:HAD hydrolase family protein [Acetilactobacillus jinshanensis]|uniref:HAD family phosphatase n=1 Tax=Acetilactobacillus jinshanensis TaxID=1720083 RepID=A0A4P6ZJV6_9LACO|nr:HAD family hydrolase [Acetilactobacillus jinshanensis]QBP17777.1 HAD family phosphatase [Acetilactobacillus jinshanensis]URL60639.1 HAD family phosphatase [uncultured bacterium]
MIRLVASRLEGMLMDQHGSVNVSGLQKRLNEMKKHGTRLVLITPKSYPYLLAKFQNVQGPLDYIAENGAEVVVDGVNVKENKLDSTTLGEILNWMSEKPAFGKTTLTLSGRLSTITNAIPGSDIDKHLKKLYPTTHWVSDLLMVASQIYQIRVDVPLPNVAEYARQLRNRFKTSIRLIKGGKKHFYILAPEVDLGNALETIQDHLKVRNRQTAAFGYDAADFDYLNAAKYSYTFPNADAQVSDIAKTLSGPARDAVVLNAIDKLLKRP